MFIVVQSAVFQYLQTLMPLLSTFLSKTLARAGIAVIMRKG